MDDTNLTLIRPKEVCELLNISIATLYRWCDNRDDFPPKIKIGHGYVGFRRSDIEAFLEEKTEPKNITA